MNVCEIKRHFQVIIVVKLLRTILIAISDGYFHDKAVTDRIVLCNENKFLMFSKIELGE